MAKARSNSKKKTPTKKKQKTSLMQTDWFKVCLFLCLIVVGIVAMLKLGVVGNFLFHFFSYFVGSFTDVFLIGLVCISGYYVFAGNLSSIKPRYWAGFIFLMMAWLLMKSASEFKPSPCVSGMKDIIMHTFNIWLGKKATTGGLIGAILLAIFGGMFDYVGAYLFVALFFVIGVVLFGYEYIAESVKDSKESLKEVAKERKQKKAEEQKYIEYLEDDTYFDDFFEERPKVKKKTSIFSNVEDVFEDTPYEKKSKSSIFSDVDTIFDEKTAKNKKNKSSVFMDVDDATSSFIDVDDPIEKETVQKESTSQPKTNEKDTNEQPATYISTIEDNYENYQLPKLSILESVSRKGKQNGSNTQNAKMKGMQLIEALNEFGVEAKLSDVHIGPSVTRFEIKPAMGVRVSRIANLQDDIKYALAAKELRIEAPIPGKSAVGIEIPNQEKVAVQMRELMDTIPDKDKDEKLLFALGRDLDGDSIFARMDKMPHLLIAGATGSGKSVCVNAIISSFLLRTKPDEVKLVLIDPKKVEFTPYTDVPHLLAPVITDADMANKALKVVVEMMDKRYELFGQIGVRNIDGYNAHLEKYPNDSLRPLPRLVVIIDELADLMLVAAKEVEGSIQRITQLARAAGIHLIVATQRPSVDVITGVIKANIPSRIAFAVSSAIDSRTILDQTGAEKLLGNGDMLYLPNGQNSPLRVQGVFIKDDEVNAITDFVKKQAKPRYDDAFITLKDIASQGGMVAQESSDPLYNEVKSFVIQSKRASTSLIQRRFSIGYSRAARLIDCLEENGIIGPANGSKPREILVQNTLEDDYSDVY